MTQRISDFINVLKNTKFYKEVIENLFVCDETPNIVWFSAKRPYGKRDEISLWNETENYDIDVCDAMYAFSDTSEDKHIYYNLKEVK